MIKIILTLCFGVFTLAVFGSGQRQTSPSDAEVMAVVDSFHKAFAAEDAEGVDVLLSDDPSFMFYGTGASDIQTSSQHFIEKHETKDWVGFDDIEFGPIEHTSIQSSPTLAVVMYQTILDFKMEGETISAPIRLVLTLVNEDGVWKIRQGLASEIVL